MGGDTVYCDGRIRDPQAHKDAIVEVEHDRTVRTLAMDALPSRLIRNRFTEVWNGHEAEICQFPEQGQLTVPIHVAAEKANIGDYMGLGAGQGSGMIREVARAGDVVRRLERETVEALRKPRACFPSRGTQRTERITPVGDVTPMSGQRARRIVRCQGR